MPGRLGTSGTQFIYFFTFTEVLGNPIFVDSFSGCWFILLK